MKAQAVQQPRHPLPSIAETEAVHYSGSLCYSTESSVKHSQALGSNSSAGSTNMSSVMNAKKCMHAFICGTDLVDEGLIFRLDGAPVLAVTCGSRAAMGR